MAGRLYKPKTKSFWILVRRLFCRKNQKPPAAAAEGEKSGLLIRSSLVTGGDAGAAVCRCAPPCAKKHGEAPGAVLLPAGMHRRPVLSRPEAATAVVSVAGRGPDGAAVHRRFMFGGIRRRLLMTRPWRPMLVAIPE